MLTSLLMGVAACVLPLCAPISLGSGVIYFPCTGQVFGETWEAYFDTNPGKVMEGTFALHYDDDRLVGYSMRVVDYVYPSPTTDMERAALFLNYDERM